MDCHIISFARLNKALQGNNVTVEGMLISVKFFRNGLENIRSEEYFSNILKDTERKISDLNLNELYVPRQRKNPKNMKISHRGRNLTLLLNKFTESSLILILHHWMNTLQAQISSSISHIVIIC